jgi:hypothetical protein
LRKCRSTHNFEKYKVARREAKKVVRKIRSTVFKDLYKKLDTKDEEKNIYRLTCFRKKKTIDNGMVKYVKDDDHKVLVKDEEINER